MDNYNQKEQDFLRLQMPLCDRQVMTELSGDFSLPDYQPEIKRLLRVQATVAPPDKYLGAGSAEFSGTVDYCILYAGNDQALYCFTQSEEYRFSVPVEGTADVDLNEGLVCEAEVLPDLAVGRVAGPRKLSVKCRLRARVKIFGTRILEEQISGAGAEAVERLCGNVEAMEVFSGLGEPLQLADEILCEGGREDLRVIFAQGQVFVTETSAGSGVVDCRGEVCLKLVCTYESEPASSTVFLRRIPFLQTVVADGAEVNCATCAHGVCSDLRVTVEDHRILCDLTARLWVHAQRNCTVVYTKDLYSTVAAGESRYGELRLPGALRCGNGNFSLNTTLALEEVGIRPTASVIDIQAQPTVLTLERERGKLCISGKCRCHVILGGEELTAQEFEIPFRYEADGVDREVTDSGVSVDVISCRARMDGTRIGVDAELAVCYYAACETTVKRLTEAHFAEPVERGTAAYTICYPSGEDTLWSVAKRYHRPIAAVAEENGLSGVPGADSVDSLAGVGYLLM